MGQIFDPVVAVRDWAARTSGIGSGLPGDDEAIFDIRLFLVGIAVYFVKAVDHALGKGRKFVPRKAWDRLLQ
ncbi:hypothetical protein [Novosphingobium olei]|uniref:hypothetical protein n=1 Tax=Novosphingobium olei TaxID=2728851 RepID=UPI00309002C5|nr:hypothetical protein NSDW_10730 [Novosphingobium olei]